MSAPTHCERCGSLLPASGALRGHCPRCLLVAAFDENPPLQPGDRLGPYEILDAPRVGGMGQVYRAKDTRLGRAVAIKVLSPEIAGDAEMKQRFEREARTLATLSHPHICPMFDVGEQDGLDFLVMEYLEGETLSARIQKGVLPVDSALQIAIQIASALEAAHLVSIIHRDIKPANVLLTKTGAKLLDFGLAKTRLVQTSAVGASALTTPPDLTARGTILGTLQYIAPEQIEGKEADARADVFAFGVVFYEMLTAKKPFTGNTQASLFGAILKDEPLPISTTNPAVPPQVEHIVRRCLAKDPDERWQTASDLMRELKWIAEHPAIDGTAVTARESVLKSAAPRELTRLIVVPFRMLRPDPEYDFLSFSLPDAITNSLSGLASLVICSSITAAKYAGTAPDLNRMAAEAKVDVVLIGTLLRSGTELRAMTQLVEARSGNVIWSQKTQLGLEDIFRLQDELVDRVVNSLAMSLTWRERYLLKHDVPASAVAYENYLRANQASTETSKMESARNMYLKCVELDPKYAPAWAQLGRSYRIISKYGGNQEDVERAETAFQRALELNPQLNLAHSFYAQFEADFGRAPQAVLRLLERVRTNGNDPNLFAGLVYACRFCGLLPASIAAHHRARRLDPLIPTSVALSYFMAGDYGRAYEAASVEGVPFHAFALVLLGRQREALELLRVRENEPEHEFLRAIITCVRALLEGKREESLAAIDRWSVLHPARGEELYFELRVRAYLGEVKSAVAALSRAVESGFICYPALVRDPWLDRLRADTAFKDILHAVQFSHQQARQIFLDAGGPEILGNGSEVI